MKLQILRAALSEFAERGFDGASVRNIARRIDQRFQLVTYYFRTKDELWRAVAEDAFTRIRKAWDEQVPDEAACSAAERLRLEYYLFFRFTIENPDFHQFMLQEMRVEGPRFEWVMKNCLDPLMGRLLPQIRAAQAAAELPMTDPVLVHHMLVASISAMATLAASIRATSGLSPDDEETRQRFWTLIEDTIFRRVAPPVDPVEVEPGPRRRKS
jgi:AcrR family transcriptional regulator